MKPLLSLRVRGFTLRFRSIQNILYRILCRYIVVAKYFFIYIYLKTLNLRNLSRSRVRFPSIHIRYYIDTLTRYLKPAFDTSPSRVYGQIFEYSITVDMGYLRKFRLGFQSHFPRVQLPLIK